MSFVIGIPRELRGCRGGLVGAFGAAMIVVGAACGGGSSPGQVTEQPADAAADPLVSNPPAALAASGDRLARDAQSVRTAFSLEISRESFSIKGDGDLAFQAPDSLHLEVSYTGRGEVPSHFAEQNESQLLVLGQQIYLSASGLEGWVIFTPQEFGSDWDVVQRLIAARSIFNYQSLVTTSPGDIEDLGSQSLDGSNYAHYRMNADVGNLMNAVVDAYGTQGQLMLANRFSGAVVADVWLDPRNLLPHRLQAKGRFPYLGAPADIELTVEFADYNTVFGLPEPPTDAKRLAELTREP